MASRPLLSAASALAKRLRSLHSASQRYTHQSFLLENRRAIEYCLARGWVPRTLILGEDEYSKLRGMTQETNPKSFEVWKSCLSSAILASAPAIVKISQASTPSGYIAEFPIPPNIRRIVPGERGSGKQNKGDGGGTQSRTNATERHPDQTTSDLSDIPLECTVATDSALPPDQESLRELETSVDWTQGGVILDNVKDPANVGTLLRSGAVFGFRQVITLECADILSYKVAQATVGALADLKIVSTTTPLLHSLIRTKRKESPTYPNIAALVIEGGVDIDTWAAQQYDSASGSTRRAANQPWIVVGSEAHGISKEVLELCTSKVTIPMIGNTFDGTDSNVGSLNANTAGSLAMYLMMRARMSKRQ